MEESDFLYRKSDSSPVNSVFFRWNSLHVCWGLLLSQSRSVLKRNYYKFAVRLKYESRALVFVRLMVNYNYNYIVGSKKNTVVLVDSFLCAIMVKLSFFVFKWNILSVL